MSPIDVWRQIITDTRKSWALFENGTCVILMEPGEDLAAQAVALMKEWGPVHPGSPAGDFGVIELPDDLGWVVTGHHDDILTLVGPDEVSSGDVNDLDVGLLGRSKRDQDSAELRIVHVEDRRSVP
jgi:hypothetical protein